MIMNPPTTKDVRVTVRLGQAQADWLADLATRSAAGGGAGMGVRLAADVLRGVMHADLRATGAWSVPELDLCAQAAGQPLLEPRFFGRLLSMEMEDLVGDQHDHWADHVGMDSGAGVHALIERLADLTPGQDLAVRDALSRWWDIQATLDTTQEGYVTVGFSVLTG